MFGMGFAGMLLMAATIAVFCIPLVIGVGLAVRFVRANELRAGDSRGTAALEQRIARLEDAIETMSRELEQVAEGQRFTTKVLAGRGESVEPK